MHKFKQLFPQSIKNLYHMTQAILANIYHGFPSRKINPHTKEGYLRFLIKFVSIFNSNWKNFGVGVKVIGITGTDGKTTTAQMVAKILEEAGKKVALASTINFRVNGVEEKNLSHYTTSSAFEVQKFISKAVENGCEYLVLETSSHSLHQYRVWGVKYASAVITNVTREHLDYHKSMYEYRKAKQKLFEIVEKNNGTAVVNLDMENPDDFLKFNAEKKYGFSVKESKLLIEDNKLEHVYAENIEMGLHGSKFDVQGVKFALNLPGMFNVENALAAISVALGEKIGLKEASMALTKIKGVPGRMEAVENEKGLNILVDFALTPNALERLYKLLSETRKPSSKIIAVFGACGERDQGKRPIMGELVSNYADYMIITNDEPYHEIPEQIINDIVSGIKGKNENEDFWKISDRREAIRKALEMAKSADIICVTGMGNFETMVVGDEKIPWNDRKVIEEELAK